jgi:hypothetical protein
MIIGSLNIGCAAVYKSPLDSQTTITFKMAEGLTRNSNQFYSIFPQAGCEESEGYGLAANTSKIMGIGGGDKVVPVSHGDRIFVLAQISQHTSANSNSCRNLISFVPERGKSYEIQQKKYCNGVVAKDLSTGEEPASFELLPIAESCKFDK